MAKEKDIFKKLESLKDNSQFKVPDGYFENLPGKIMDSVQDNQNEVQESEKRPVFIIIRNQLAIAASFAALFLLAYSAIKIIAPDKSSDNLTENEIFASLESELFELDETVLFNLANNESIESIETNGLTEQEIIDYLIEEGDELDLSINDL